MTLCFSLITLIHGYDRFGIAGCQGYVSQCESNNASGCTYSIILDRFKIAF